MTHPPIAGAIHLTARAKLNLYLHVLGRRADGYHELDSLAAFAAFGDRLTLAPAEDLRLEVEGPFAKTLAGTSGNLVVKAAHLLKARFNVAGGALIHLEKRIPVAAGLGGGSADAAATLNGLARLWGLEPRSQDLARLALELGTDVPVCLDGRPAFVGGIGDRLDPAPPMPEAGLVLANPCRPLPTPAVYAARRGPFSAPARWSLPVGEPEVLARLLSDRRNDLTRPALALAPEIGEVLAALSALPGVLLARMSGSGATCFGLTRGSAEAAAEALRADRPGWWIVATRLDARLGKLG